MQPSGCGIILPQAGLRDFYGQAWTQVGKDGDDAFSAERHDRRDLIVVPGPDVQRVAAEVADAGDLRKIAAGFLHAVDAWMKRKRTAGFRLKIHARAGGNVVCNQRQGSRVGDRGIVGDQAALRGLVIVWSHGQQRIRAAILCLLRKPDGRYGAVCANSRDYLAASGTECCRAGNQRSALLLGQCRSLTGRAANDDGGDACMQLDGKQMVKCVKVELTCAKRRNECGRNAGKYRFLHRNTSGASYEFPGGSVRKVAFPACMRYTMCRVCWKESENALKTSDFYYELPPELIAQTPLERRDASRLMVLDPVTETIEHRHFYDLGDYLQPGDCLVMNDSRVLPARLLGKRVPTGGAVEVLLLQDKGEKTWECLVKPGRKLHEGAQISFGDGMLTAEVTQVLESGNRLVKFHYEGIFLEILEQLGKMPLPPYIKEELADGERYQTVYSRVTGSAAAPTAGLHFTKELLAQLETKGVRLAYITLHVGLGTFRPVKVDDVTQHHMHSEFCMISAETAQLLNETRAGGGRIVCVGTTSCRTLESLADENGNFTERSAWTDIFIYPGYRFRAMDALITNFHLPESTLIMLVSAFAGYGFTMRAYREAVQERYRFFSFGDACFFCRGQKK